MFSIHMFSNIHALHFQTENHLSNCFVCFSTIKRLNMSLNSEQTNLYASQNNATNSLFKPFEIHEIKRFVGILFLSEYHQIPSWKLYWSKEPDFQVEIVKM